LIDEALRHVLAAEDLPAALRLMAQHRCDLINQEQWPLLASWLRRFPDELQIGLLGC
jgi:ATP/maltotriose-dependent transcriptional regulator MalT